MSFRIKFQKTLASFFLVFALLGMTPNVTNAQFSVGGRHFNIPLGCFNGVFLTWVQATPYSSIGLYTILWVSQRPFYHGYGYGQYVKGKYFTPAVPCMYYCGVSVCSWSARGTIYDYGTSLE